MSRLILAVALLLAAPVDAHRINLNTATLAELQAVPGVTRDLAAQLVAHRRNIGGWRVLPKLPAISAGHVKLTGETTK